MGLGIGAQVEAGGGHSIAADETARVVRDRLRPHFEELAQCGSTPELLGHSLYRQIQPLADRVLATTENGTFAPPDAPAKSSYRLLAWNIERGIEFEAQMEEFGGHDYLRSADVLLLTETDVGMARSGNRNVARDLARELGLNYAFAPCYLNLSKGAGVESESSGENDVGLHGNALLSRYPLRNPRRIALGNGRDKMRGREKRLGQQAAIAAEVDLPGLPLTACSVHLDAQSRQLRDPTDRIHRPHLRVQPAIMARLVRLSATGTLQTFIATASWIGLIRVTAEFGAEALAGYVIAIRIILFAILPAWGLSNAAATMVGQGLGAGDPDRAERAVWISCRMNLAFLGAVGLAFLVFAPQIVGIFGGTGGATATAVDGLRIVAIGFVFYAYGLVLTSAFNGAGAVWTPTILNFFCFWLWEIPLAWTLAFPLGLGPNGVFIAMTVSFSTLAVVSAILFKRGRWRKAAV